MMRFLKLTIVLPLIAVFVLIVPRTVEAAPGDLDTTFDPGQILWEGSDFPAFKYAAVLQADGKLVIGGHFDTVGPASRIFIARLNGDGTLDTSFTSPFQKVTINGFSEGEVYDILQQPDGRFLVSGYFMVGAQYKTVVRLNNNGTIDGSFDVVTNGGSTSFNHIYRMLLQPDGKIIIGSNALQSVNGVTTNSLARLTSTGGLDSPLGVTGNVTYSVFALALQPDGKILVGGGGGSGGVVGRLNPDGTEDPGWTYPDIGLISVDCLAIEADGQILVGARGRLLVNGVLRDGLIRLNPNGTFDTSFDPPDIRVAWTLYVQSDGKIAVGGSFTVDFGLFLSTFGRLNPDGSLDFMCDSGPDNDLLDIVRQPDGKYLVTGTFENYFQGNQATVRTGVARILEAPSPLTGKIVYQSRPDGVSLDVVSMNADGTNKVTLTAVDGASDYDPSLSGDGTKIVFVSNRDGDEDIFVMNSDGTGQTALTVNNDIEITPAFSPDGTKIVFASQRDGNYEIYTMNANGTNQTRLTNTGPFRDDEPSFSPDGSKIVFTSHRDGNPEIYVMNADGTNQTRLTTNTVNDSYGTFSPDGSKIAFTSFRDGNAEIYVMRANGSAPVRITNNASTDTHPFFSPDGSRIAFSTNRDGAGAPGLEIYVMNVSGSNPIRYTTNSVEDSNPWWGGAPPQPATGKIYFDSRPSPAFLEIASMNLDGSGRTPLTTTGFDYGPSVSADGNKVAFVSLRDKTFEEIYIMNGDGTGQTRLTTNDEVDLDPAISADGTKIVFASLRDGNWEIYTMNSNGGNLQRVTNNTFRDEQPSFSPDGSKIVFRSNRDGDPEIYVMDANGANPMRLTTDTANDFDPVFSPDGSKITWRTSRDGNFEIYSINANGTNPIRLTNNAAIDSDPAYSPDGSRIVFVSQRDGNPEIYVMNNDGTIPVRVTTNTIEDGRPSWGGGSGAPPPPQSKLKVAGGNILIGSPGEGIILKSPSGTTCIKLGIDDSGAMTTVIIPCP